VDHLRERGFAVSGMSGPGGALHLEATSVLLTSHLQTDEVIALSVSVAVARETTSIPFADGADRALAKIEAALPRHRVGELQRFMQRVLIGDTVPDVRIEHTRIDQKLVVLFDNAFTCVRLLTFIYTVRLGQRR